MYNKRKREHSTLLFYFNSVVRVGGACAMAGKAEPEIVLKAKSFIVLNT